MKKEIEAGLIKHYGYIYQRHTDMMDRVLPETIEELHRKVRQEFMTLSYPVKFVAEELNDMDEVKRRLDAEGVLYISSLHNTSDLFPGELNLALRAWHDAIHLGNNYPFDFQGEWDTWKRHCEGISYQAKQVLFSEIVLQTAYFLSYGHYPDTQKIVLVDISNHVN